MEEKEIKVERKPENVSEDRINEDVKIKEELFLKEMNSKEANVSSDPDKKSILLQPSADFGWKEKEEIMKKDRTIEENRDQMDSADQGWKVKEAEVSKERR